MDFFFIYYHMSDKKANFCSKKSPKYVDKHLFWCYHENRTNVLEHIFSMMGGASMKKYLFLFAVSVMILSCLLGRTLVTASGEERESGYNRYYTNVEIRQGDTLWSIAERYRANSGMEIRQYVSELKEINGLVSDSIEAGDSITVVYYSTQPGMLPPEK